MSFIDALVKDLPLQMSITENMQDHLEANKIQK
jgi:hypothetical protein